MRRFSQRNSLVTLSEINITPLLDLAFVLLIIFVITRPLLENSIDLSLPQGGRTQGKIDPRDVRRVEVTPQGSYKLDGSAMTLAQVEGELIRAFQGNPSTIVSIRADENGPYKHVAAVMDLCQRRGITRFSFATQPPK
ncbi:MAG: biopolymer transporter ExbD [Verrucomicrobia bacterium]|nr:biopolymer transporter ExbD [Verrucomicrobiota bacterium]